MSDAILGATGKNQYINFTPEYTKGLWKKAGSCSSTNWQNTIVKIVAFIPLVLLAILETAARFVYNAGIALLRATAYVWSCGKTSTPPNTTQTPNTNPNDLNSEKDKTPTSQTPPTPPKDFTAADYKTEFQRVYNEIGSVPGVYWKTCVRMAHSHPKQFSEVTVRDIADIQRVTPPETVGSQLQNLGPLEFAALITQIRKTAPALADKLKTAFFSVNSSTPPTPPSADEEYRKKANAYTEEFRCELLKIKNSGVKEPFYPTCVIMSSRYPDLFNAVTVRNIKASLELCSLKGEHEKLLCLTDDGFNGLITQITNREVADYLKAARSYVPPDDETSDSDTSATPPNTAPTSKTTSNDPTPPTTNPADGYLKEFNKILDEMKFKGGGYWKTCIVMARRYPKQFSDITVNSLASIKPVSHEKFPYSQLIFLNHKESDELITHIRLANPDFADQLEAARLIPLVPSDETSDSGKQATQSTSRANAPLAEKPVAPQSSSAKIVLDTPLANASATSIDTSTPNGFYYLLQKTMNEVKPGASGFFPRVAAAIAVSHPVAFDKYLALHVAFLSAEELATLDLKENVALSTQMQKTPYSFSDSFLSAIVQAKYPAAPVVKAGLPPKVEISEIGQFYLYLHQEMNKGNWENWPDLKPNEVPFQNVAINILLSQPLSFEYLAPTIAKLTEKDISYFTDLQLDLFIMGMKKNRPTFTALMEKEKSEREAKRGGKTTAQPPKTEAPDAGTTVKPIPASTPPLFVPIPESLLNNGTFGGLRAMQFPSSNDPLPPIQAAKEVAPTSQATKDVDSFYKSLRETMEQINKEGKFKKGTSDFFVALAARMAPIKGFETYLAPAVAKLTPRILKKAELEKAVSPNQFKALMEKMKPIKPAFVEAYKKAFQENESLGNKILQQATLNRMSVDESKSAKDAATGVVSFYEWLQDVLTEMKGTDDGLFLKLAGKMATSITPPNLFMNGPRVIDRPYRLRQQFVDYLIPIVATLPPESLKILSYEEKQDLLDKMTGTHPEFVGKVDDLEITLRPDSPEMGFSLYDDEEILPSSSLPSSGVMRSSPFHPSSSTFAIPQPSAPVRSNRLNFLDDDDLNEDLSRFPSLMRTRSSLLEDNTERASGRLPSAFDVQANKTRTAAVSTSPLGTPSARPPIGYTNSFLTTEINSRLRPRTPDDDLTERKQPEPEKLYPLRTNVLPKKTLEYLAELDAQQNSPTLESTVSPARTRKTLAQQEAEWEARQASLSPTIELDTQDGKRVNTGMTALRFSQEQLPAGQLPSFDELANLDLSSTPITSAFRDAFVSLDRQADEILKKSRARTKEVDKATDAFHESAKNAEDWWRAESLKSAERLAALKADMEKSQKPNGSEKK